MVEIELHEEKGLSSCLKAAGLEELGVQEERGLFVIRAGFIDEQRLVDELEFKGVQYKWER